MNTSGEVADLMVKEGIQITESAVKLAGLGAKNLAAIIVVLMNDKTKLQGKTNLKQLLKSDKPLCILQIKESDLKKFNQEAKKYGVLFTAVSDKTNNTGLCDVIAKQDDVTKLNYIMEKLGYTAPTNEEMKHDSGQRNSPDENKEKNSKPRVREVLSENRYAERGDTENLDRKIKTSVRDKINDIKARRTGEKKLFEKAINRNKKRGVSR